MQKKNLLNVHHSNHKFNPKSALVFFSRADCIHSFVEWTRTVALTIKMIKVKMTFEITGFVLVIYRVFHRTRSLKVFMEGIERKFWTLTYLFWNLLFLNKLLKTFGHFLLCRNRHQLSYFRWNSPNIFA